VLVVGIENDIKSRDLN